MIKMTNMCIVEDGENFLVQIREKQDWPGLTFPGGKVEAHESIYESCIREVKEETGLEVSHLKLCGIIHYDLVGSNEQTIIFLFKTSCFKGKLLTTFNEGKVYWLAKKDILKKNLSSDLEKYLELYEHDEVVEIFLKWDGKTSSEYKMY